MGATGVVLYDMLTFTRPTEFLLPVRAGWNWIPLNILHNLFFCALFSLFMDKYDGGSKRQTRVVFAVRMLIYVVLIFIFLLAPICFYILPVVDHWGLFTLCGCAGMYVFLAVVDEMWLKKWGTM
jgi:hypothetical protein